MIEPKLIPLVQKGFGKTARLLLKKQFGALYWDSESAHLPNSVFSGQVFFVATHQSWWDPLSAAEIAINQFGLRVLAPMEEEAFLSYPSLRYVGVFGVKSGDGPQVEAYLKSEFQQHPSTAVWVTPSGQFWPNELKNPPFKSGISRWSMREGSLRIPTVVHYAFGPEEKPNVFVRLGSAIPWTLGSSVEEDSDRLSQALSFETQALLKKVYDSGRGSRFRPDGFLKSDWGWMRSRYVSSNQERSR
jgi:hypothetical protein